MHFSDQVTCKEEKLSREKNLDFPAFPSDVIVEMLFSAVLRR
jgi:hypothetical protein